MTLRNLYEIEIDGTTDETNVSLTSELDFDDDNEIDSVEFNVLSNFECKYNDELKYYDYTNTNIFNGIIRDIENDNPKKIIVYKYDILLVDRIVDDIYEGYQLEDLIEHIVTNFSSLSFSTDFVSGITIDKYVSKNKTAYEVVKDLISLVPNLTYNIDNNKVFHLFVKKSQSSGIILENGVNCNVLSGWKEDATNHVTRLTLIGAKQVQQDKVQTYNGDGSETTFTLSEIPRSIKVEVDSGSGFVEKELNVEGQRSGDYNVIPQKKQVIFLAGSIPPAGTDNVKITYTFEINIKLEYDASPDVIDKYGIIEKKVTKKYIDNEDDAFNFCSQYMNTYQEPLISSRIAYVDSLDITNLIPGYSIEVKDDINTIEGENINDTFIIRKVKRLFPSSGVIIDIGEIGVGAIDIIKEAKYNVRQLYEEDDNSSIIQKSQVITDNVTLQVDIDVENIEKRTYFDDTFYLCESSISRNLMKEDGTGPVMREKGYTTIELDSLSYSISTESSFSIATESGVSLATEGSKEDTINSAGLTIYSKNFILDSFLIELNSLVEYVAVGDDNTTPIESDTTLGNETYREINYSKTLNPDNMSITTRIDETENNGNTINEIGIFDESSGGNMYSHNLVTSFEKTSSKVAYYRIVLQPKVEDKIL